MSWLIIGYLADNCFMLMPLWGRTKTWWLLVFGSGSSLFSLIFNGVLLSSNLHSKLGLLVSVELGPFSLWFSRHDIFPFLLLPLGPKLIWTILRPSILVWHTCFLSLRTSCLPRSSLGSGNNLLKRNFNRSPISSHLTGGWPGYVWPKSPWNSDHSIIPLLTNERGKECEKSSTPETEGRQKYVCDEI